MLVSVADLFDEARMALFPARLQKGERQTRKQRPNQHNLHRAESNTRARGHKIHILYVRQYLVGKMRTPT
jgi:hypothetical protein